RQGKTCGQFSHTLAHVSDCVKVLNVEENFTDHVGDGGHFRLFHAAGCHCGSPKTDATGLEGRASLEGNGVFVDGDASFVKGSLAVFASETLGADIDEH